MSGPVAIFLFFLLLLVDMFFYGFDAAIDNLNEKEILHKAEEEKDRRSMRLSEMISRPGIYINTVQLVITLINILMGAFYLNIWLQTIDDGLHVINVGGLTVFVYNNDHLKFLGLHLFEQFINIFCLRHKIRLSEQPIQLRNGHIQLVIADVEPHGILQM